MNGTERDADVRLDRALAALPRELAPPRDLWPGVAAQLDGVDGARGRRRWLWQAAAAVLLMAGSSLLTAVLLQRDRSPVAAVTQAPATARATTGAPRPTGAGSGVPAAYALDPDSLEARRRLVESLAAQMQSLPPSARLKVERNLAEMRRAADEINAALHERPGDPLLEELLVGAYQAELAVLSSLNQVTGREPRRVGANETRMPL